jgi:hypothetical protein
MTLPVLRTAYAPSSKTSLTLMLNKCMVIVDALDSRAIWELDGVQCNQKMHSRLWIMMKASMINVIENWCKNRLSIPSWLLYNLRGVNGKQGCMRDVNNKPKGFINLCHPS